MTRSAARELALGCIFEYGYYCSGIEEIISNRFENLDCILIGEDKLFNEEVTENDKEYVNDILTSYDKNREEIKDIISKLAVDWDLARISRMSMAILSLAITEIKCRDDVPLSVAINEAVTLAKKYDSEKAPAFINGILGSYSKTLTNAEEE